MKTRLLLASALALVAVQGMAQAAPSDAQAWADRMALAGVTVRPGDLPPAPVSATPAAQTAEAYAQRQLALAGVTVRPGDLPAAPIQQDVATDGNAQARIQKHLNLIGVPTNAYVVQPLVQAGY